MNRWIARVMAALCLALLLSAAGTLAVAEAAQAEDITKKCAFRVSEGEKGKATDTNVRTAWSYKKVGAWLAAKVPDGVTPGWLRVEWMFNPTGFEVNEYDASLNQLRTRTLADTFPNIYTVMELLPEAKYVQLVMTAKDQEVCTVKLYSAGQLPGSVQVWNPPVEKADLMVVSTHQDDELIFLGGTIPYYATALKKPTIVVYMANCTRYRRNEALNALWKMGVRDYPEFINLQDKRTDTFNQAVELWGGKDNILSLIVERIRRFKPEVIVTQDLNGEYGHNQHKVTARAMKYAVDAAADPTRYPESASLYGAWQVKKLYHHLYEENTLMMDWETPLDSLNGYSPLKVAQIGMNEHASQLKYYSVKSHGTYDNAKFGLYFTTVGEDVAKNDFLEHIDPDASAKYLEEHAADYAAQRAAAQAAANAALAEAAAQAEEENAEDDASAAAATAADAPSDTNDATAETSLPATNDATAEEKTPATNDATAEDATSATNDATGEAGAAKGDVTAEAGSTDDPGTSAAMSPADDALAAAAPADAGTSAAMSQTAATGLADPAPRPTAIPQTAHEQGGNTRLAVAMLALTAAGLGAGGWYVWDNVMRPRRRHRRRRR